MKTVAADQALSAYADAARRAASDRGAAGPDGGFSRMLANEMSRAVETLKTGETVSTAAVRGEASAQEVVEAITEAELMLQKVTAVRDRVVSAYQEIMRMPI